MRPEIEPFLCHDVPMAGDLEVVIVLEWMLCISELVVEMFVSPAWRPQGPGAF